MPDPVARAIGQLLDHLQAVDGKLDGMCGALKELGSSYCAKDLPELREEDFAWVTRKLMEIADKSAEGRIVSVLEGGYDLQGLRDSVAVHVAALMNN